MTLLARWCNSDDPHKVIGKPDLGNKSIEVVDDESIS
jgi:hypothetical protein